ncbi:methylenetetrahydrofolate reductase (NADPH) [Prosthecobacter fusiformis]|uniref:Methylenetetrahydrofolate reductase n=1 Tax=Prosthecobacter fusiformis TaxID=48464 RepID=A0A4R7SRS5_9BACT|nr:methylenetetrahydrofolate reductase [NAD(P)H] [Prosthecobacter fusiformis]TDU80868.1 methylenetetrahydrofolate reductase (NADPH) [Prosthecobacter fusiformis]
MHIKDILLAAGRPTLSFEFFPPRTADAVAVLQESLHALAPWRPDFVSVTYGAGGSTRERTGALVGELRQSDVFDPIPHVTCVGQTEAEMQTLLEKYAAAGVSNVLALRGDLPAGTDAGGDFQTAADLVRFIRRFNERGLHPDARGFGIGVACFPEGHPGTPNRMVEMDHLKAKVDAGADWMCTQVFFDNHDFHDFRARCELEGIQVPILAGILPLTQASSLRRMAELAAGARYPAKLLRALERTRGDEEGFRQVGIHHAVMQCADLLDHEVAGLHFYTLNQAAATVQVLRGLGYTGKNR